MTRSGLRFSSPVLIAGATAALFIGSLVMLLREHDSAVLRPSSSTQQKSGVEVIAILLTAGSCPAMNEPSFRRTYREIVAEMSSAASDYNANFATIGVALDERPQVGLEALVRLGSFDEISSGRGWRNYVGSNLLNGSLPLEHVIPQLVVIARLVDQESGFYTFMSDTVLARLIGPAAFSGSEAALARLALYRFLSFRATVAGVDPDDR